MLTRAPRGTRDTLPSQIYKWHHVENKIRKLCSCYGYREIRTPVFEHTELFERGVGGTTDIVQKEMYTFTDKGNRSLTLKPEGTASVVRAFIEHKLYADTLPLKMYYLSPVFRYERPQAGRLREHHQFGVEAFGSQSTSVDTEIIDLAMTLFNTLGINNLQLNINSIGCPKCRKDYNAALKAYLDNNKESLCGTCKDRLEKNPMRIIDCKEPKCQTLVDKAPLILDYLCGECNSHFEELQHYLKTLDYSYVINPRIVRGLDYYTKTVFEIISNDIGAQGTVCGGGRYDGLIEECGGPSLPGVGFGLGLERLLMVMEHQGIEIPEPVYNDVSIVSIGDEGYLKAFSLASRLRAAGVATEIDHMGKSIRAQFKKADKLGSRFCIIIGEEELLKSRFKVKNMLTGSEEEMDETSIIQYFKETIK